MAPSPLDAIEKALASRVVGTLADASLTPAAVMLLLYPRNGEYCVLLNKRSEEVEYHKGEISFPGGARDPYGQHLTWAMSNTPWGEYYIGSDPGIPLAEVAQPGAMVPENGYLDFTATGPGFDLGIAEDWLEPFVL